MRKVSESAMLGTQSEKVTAAPSGQGHTQPSTCTHVHAQYPGTSPFHFTTKGSLGLSTHYKGFHTAWGLTACVQSKEVLVTPSMPTGKSLG